MTIHAKTATLFSALGLLIGGVAVIGAQVHAQSAVTPSVTQVPTMSPVSTPSDTDNIQDANGVEKVDTPSDKPDGAAENSANDQEKAD